jgi:membrane protein insertase Oxa1/YidC/SpoIIIJ
MMSGPFMALIFGVMFYHVQSGLVLYWLTNSLMSILLYRLVK